MRPGRARRAPSAPPLRGRLRTGIAILIVLSIIVLLATLSYSFHDLVVSNLKISRKDVDRFRALQLARAGLNLAVTLVKLDPQFAGGSHTFLPDPAYQAKQLQNGVTLTKIEEVYMMLRMSEATGIPLENGQVKVAIRDEAGRFNVNSSLQAPDFLINLMRVCNVRKRKKLVFSDTTAADDASIPLSNALLDWLDPDNTARPEGAENSFYMEAKEEKPSYKARNGPLESIDEMMLVRHMDRSMMDGVPGNDHTPASLPVKDFVTVYGTTPIVNANSASPEVLAAIPGIFESANRQALVMKLIANRPLRDGGAIAASINEVDSSALAKAARFLGTRSNMLRIKVSAELGTYEGTIETVLLRDPAGFLRTLYWREN